MTCDEKLVDSVPLPAPAVELPCRSCAKGEYFDQEVEECYFCQEGYYQPKDYHNDRTKNITCTKCPAGKYAERVIEFEHFEGMPSIMKTSCTTATSVGNEQYCDVIFGFHYNLDGLLDSGLGIPQGLKLLLSTKLDVQTPDGGKVVIHYKLLNFNKHEKEVFRINLDGEKLLERKESTTDNAESSTFEEFSYSMIPTGSHVLDIVLLSMFEKSDPGYQSNARVLIKKIQIIGSEYGGAQSCKPCPSGQVSIGPSSFCSICAAGYEPSPF